ncbi:MAG: NTP transferase domain-containing protein [Sedimentisphaerales bacterium]|nr:NTP transferase domain-containing protein [Sedimentisphaerales bacterium]
MVKRKAVILAAGQSTRMNTRQSKVLHEVCGRPMLEYVLDACRRADVDQLIVVVGYGREQVIERYNGCDDIVFVEQAEQKGTGHAVLCCKEHLEGFDGETLILCGDTPLLRTETLKTLITKHKSEASAITLATTIMDNPKGYGRIIRDEYGNVQGIVEENDCTDPQRIIKEVNPAYYCFNTPVLMEALEKITPDNAKGEYYLTDALHIAIASGHKVVAVTAVSAEDAMGVNDRNQLSIASKIMQQRIQENFMASGVTIVDPPNTWIDSRAKIGQDTIIEPFTYIHGEVMIGSNCRVGPFAYLRDKANIADGVELDVFYNNKDS